MTAHGQTVLRQVGPSRIAGDAADLHGHVRGVHAGVPQAQFGPVKVPDGPPTEQFLYLSDVLSIAYQAVVHTDVPDGGTLAVLDLGQVGHVATRDRPAPRGQMGDRGRRRAAAALFGVETVDPEQAVTWLPP